MRVCPILESPNDVFWSSLIVRSVRPAVAARRQFRELDGACHHQSDHVGLFSHSPIRGEHSKKHADHIDEVQVAISIELEILQFDLNVDGIEVDSSRDDLDEINLPSI